MALEVEDQILDDDHLNFLWENQSWDLSNSENSDDENNKKKLSDIVTTNTPDDQNKGLIFIGESSDGGVVAGGEESRVKSNKRDYRGIRNHGKRVSGDGKCREEADHELHIWTERERRKKMRNMFDTLHALLPHLPSKADKSTIVDEAVRCIKSLQKTVEKLEILKREKDQQGMSSPIGCESSVLSSHWNPYYFDSSSSPITDQVSSSNNNSAARVVSNSSSVPVASFKTFASQNLVLTMFGNNEAQYSICCTKKQGLSTTIAFVLDKYKLDVISARIFCNGNTIRYMIFAHANKGLVQFQDAGSVEQTFRRAAGEIMMWLS